MEGTPMLLHRMSSASAIFVSAALLITAIPGCSKDESASAQELQPAVDPRFATAEALLAYFNSLNTQLPPDALELAAICYAENEFQSKYVETIRRGGASDYYQLDKAMYERFGEPLLDYAAFKRRWPKRCTPAVIERTYDRRVEGSFKDEDGEKRPLHLVQIGERWWVSGYTFEYRIKEADRASAEFGIELMLSLSSSSNHEYLQPIIANIRNGQYATAKEARAAHQNAFRQWLRQKYP
jgi:hypothetical protein